MSENLNTIREGFRTNIENLETLANFDSMILNLCINTLKNVSKFASLGGVSKPKIDNAITELENIQTNKSLKEYYKTIYNLIIVLLVSFLSSALETLFVFCVNHFPNKLNRIDKKVSFEDLKYYDFDIKSNLGELIVRTQGLSFQNMDNTFRIFKDYLNIDINGFSKNKDINKHIENIKFIQASRHCIVHNGSKVDDKFKNQIKSLKVRSINIDISQGEIMFNKENLEKAKDSSLEFMNSMIDIVEKKTKYQEVC